MANSNICWGIEVGAGAIKALRLERDGETLRVGDFAVLPHKKVLSTPDLNRDEAIAVALGGFMSQYRDALRGARVAVSIPGHSAFARFAKLPPVEKKGVANLVRFEAVQQIPFPIDEVEWDFQTFASDDSPDIEVGIFAVTKAKISEVLAQYGEQALVPDIITLSPVAVYNAVAYDLSFTDKTPGTVILDIGTTASDLIIADAGKVWVRTFPLGGHNFTEALASTFKLTYGKAEKLKKEAETSKYKRHIFQALKPVLQELVQDVQRSIGYYKDTHPEAQITRVVGVGSTFKLIGLRKLLSQQLRLEVFRYERAKRLNIDGAAAADFEAATPNLATAYGLALQGLGLQTINANLMPLPVIRKAMWRRKTPWFVAAAGIGIAGAALAFARPFLDSMAANRARADSTVTSPIRQAVSLGQSLKSKWTEASGAKQPGFVAENMRRLLEGRDLYPRFLDDLSGMFSAAAEYGVARGLALKSPIAELRQFQTDYLAPGSSLSGGRVSSPSSFGQRGGTGADEGAGASAGAAGAVRFTLVFDSPQDSLAFVNDSFLAWLRTNAQRAGVPYTLTAIPAPVAVTKQPIPPPASRSMPQPGPGAGGQRSPQSPAPPSGDRDQGSSGDDDIPTLGGRNTNRSAPPPPTRSGGSPFGPGAPSGPRGDAEVDRLAPIPDSLKAPPRTETHYRYTITWVAQVRPLAEMEQEAAATAGQESSQ